MGKAHLSESRERYDETMRLRTLLPALALSAVVLILPYTAFAQTIPFFGPIIPSGSDSINRCALGWPALITVINNIIMFSITMAIVFVAPLMIAWSGFLFVVNPVNASGREQAKSILLHTIVGIVIALAGWMIVDAIMAVLTPNGKPFGENWSSLITGSGDICLPLKGSLNTLDQSQVTGSTATGGLTVVPPACGSIQPLSLLIDPLAVQMENGQTVIWANTNPQLQTCVNKFVSQVGGTVTSAYRPPAYQNHLWEIRDRWCTQNLQSNSDSACSALKANVSGEFSKHGLSCDRPVAVDSNHSAGTAVDISGINQGAQPVLTAAANSCLTWFGAGDPVHYTLNTSCTCN